MRIPPQILASDPTLNPNHGLPFYPGLLIVRSPDLKTVHDEVDWSHALALALTGSIEGVATASGRLRYFRFLPPAERPSPDTMPAAHNSQSDTIALNRPAGCIANTKMGAFREPVKSLRPTGAIGLHGEPVLGAETIGWIWQLYLARVGR